jgi:acyl-CoA synthetase (AMP-forming)/AMP-acid ligase II
MGNDRKILGDSSVQYVDFRTIMLDNARSFGSKEYIVSVDQGKSITFKEFDECTKKVANFLSERGLKKSDFITLNGYRLQILNYKNMKTINSFR